MTAKRVGAAAILRAGIVLGAGLVASLASTTARADGYPPFFGYSPYFGSPATYFTPDDTIHEVTNERDGEYGFGTRTYYRGGPFWTLEPTQRRRVASARSRSRQARRVVLQRKY